MILLSLGFIQNRTSIKYTIVTKIAVKKVCLSFCYSPHSIFVSLIFYFILRPLNILFLCKQDNIPFTSSTSHSPGEFEGKGQGEFDSKVWGGGQGESESKVCPSVDDFRRGGRRKSLGKVRREDRRRSARPSTRFGGGIAVGLSLDEVWRAGDPLTRFSERIVHGPSLDNETNALPRGASSSCLQNLFQPSHPLLTKAR